MASKEHTEVFNDYARYYDLLYKDKNYMAESSYLDNLIRKYHPEAKSILNLGCGTGKHDVCFEEKGYSVCGVDLSETMLVEARKRMIPGKLEFFNGDIRNIELHKKFDVVMALFHVMNYQTTLEDIRSTLQTVNKHCHSGGVFIFDFWHGLGVTNDPPVVRVKRLEDEAIKVVRIAEPVIKKDENIVDVNFQILIFDKSAKKWTDLSETHSMRYFFLKELENFLSESGFVLKKAYEWLTNEPLSKGWYGLVIAEKCD